MNPLKLFDDLKHLSNIVAETAAARLALSQALTGRVLPSAPPLPEPMIRQFPPKPQDKEKEKTK